MGGYGSTDTMGKAREVGWDEAGADRNLYMAERRERGLEAAVERSMNDFESERTSLYPRE